MSGDAPGEWVSVAEAARRLGVTPRAVRLRIKHHSLDARARGNAGREVFIPNGTTPRGAFSKAQGGIPTDAPGDYPGEHPRLAVLVETVTELHRDLAEALARAARAEGRAERAEGRAEVLDAALARELAMVAELRRELAEARRPLVLRILEGLRRR